MKWFQQNKTSTTFQFLEGFFYAKDNQFEHLVILIRLLIQKFLNLRGDSQRIQNEKGSFKN